MESDCDSGKDYFSPRGRPKYPGAVQRVGVVIFLWNSIWNAPPLHHAAHGVGEQ